MAKVITVGSLSAFSLDFELKFYDRYNWDGGKSVTIAGVTITDEAMGEFHRQGLAKEFDCTEVVIVAEATGSGKTTQLPKVLLAMGRGRPRQIGVTQPRRIAATSVAARVARELGTERGTDVPQAGGEGDAPPGRSRGGERGA